MTDSSDKFADLRNDIRGSVSVVGDANYSEASRIFNQMYQNRKAALVVTCLGASDVSKAVKFANANNLPISIKSGGHGPCGNALKEGALVIDLSKMRSVQVDAKAKIAHIEPGALLADVDHETAAFGLATVLGTVALTGVGGLTLHGGIGFLSWKYGASVQNIVGLQVVLADGSIQEANPEENQDLFWACRGAAGNFGVVTRIDMKLHPVDQVIGGVFFIPAPTPEVAAKAHKWFRDTINGQAEDRKIFGQIALVNGPPPECPPLLLCHVGHFGTKEEAEKDFKGLLDLGPIAMGAAPGPIPFYKLQNALTPILTSHGLARNYWKAVWLPKDVGDEYFDTLAREWYKRPKYLIGSMAVLETHGPVKGLDKEDLPVTSMSNFAFDMPLLGLWTDEKDDKEAIGWVKGLYDKLVPSSNNKVWYVIP